MNRFYLKLKKKREKFILFGFIIEIINFFAAGMGFSLALILRSKILLSVSLLYIISGIIIALIVGKEIEKNGIINDKFGL